MFSHYTPFYSPFASAGIGAVLFPLILLAIIWTVVLKGFSLWYAARGSQKWWFIALLIINTLGILEIIYLIWFRKHDHTPTHSSSAQA